MDAGNGCALHQKQLPAVATLFTTHATSIGRSIAGNNKALYAYMDGYNGDQMAGELNMEAKHSLKTDSLACGLLYYRERHHCPRV